LSVITFLSIINILMLIKRQRPSDSTEEVEDTIREEFTRNRTELIGNLSLNRTESSKQFSGFQDTMLNRVTAMENSQRINFEGFLKEQRQKFADFEQEQKEISNLINLNLKEIRDTSDKKMTTIIDFKQYKRQRYANGHENLHGQHRKKSERHQRKRGHKPQIHANQQCRANRKNETNRR